MSMEHTDLPDSLAHVQTISILPQLPEDTSLWVWWDDRGEKMLVRRLDDRRYVGILPLLFTHAVIWGYTDDAWGYEDRWCYHSAREAIAAASRWDGTGEPEGWHRHPRTGRRRENGDPSTEYVNP